MKGIQQGDLTYQEGEEIKTVTINYKYARDLVQYPLGDKNAKDAWLRDGEFVNRMAAACNNLSYRLHKPDPSIEIPIKYVTQQYTIADFNRTADIFLTKAVSSNFVIDTNGDVYLFVDPNYRAYALGLGNLSYPSKLNPDIEEALLKSNLNSYAIAITSVNDGKSYFTPEQIQSNLGLLAALYQSTNFPDLVPSLMIGQNDWTPGRMTGPGPYFHSVWEKCAEAGFGVFPKVTIASVGKVLLSWKGASTELDAWGNVKKLKEYGYDIPQKDVDSGKMTEAVGKALLAFRLHFSGDVILSDPQQKAWWDNYVFLTRKQSQCKEGTYSPTDTLKDLNEEVQKDLLIELLNPSIKGDNIQANAIGRVYQQYLENLAIFTERDAAKIDNLLEQFSELRISKHATATRFDHADGATGDVRCAELVGTDHTQSSDSSDTGVGL
jgi:N-acetyl-anhydromuramyl-L-alanine amidase AmpD